MKFVYFWMIRSKYLSVSECLKVNLESVLCTESDGYFAKFNLFFTPELAFIVGDSTTSSWVEKSYLLTFRATLLLSIRLLKTRWFIVFWPWSFWWSWAGPTMSSSAGMLKFVSVNYTLFDCSISFKVCLLTSPLPLSSEPENASLMRIFF